MASAVHKDIEPKVAAVNVNSVCRQLSQNTAEQEFAAPDEFVAEVQWSMAIRKLIAGLEFGDALKLLMNDRDMSVEQMESESGLSVSTVKRLRAGQEASAEQIVAISVALRLPPMVSSDLLRMCGITLDFNNQRNTVYQMILTGHYKDGIEQRQKPTSKWRLPMPRRRHRRPPLPQMLRLKPTARLQKACLIP